MTQRSAATAEIPFNMRDAAGCRDGAAFIAENMTSCLASGQWSIADIEAMLWEVVNRSDELHGLVQSGAEYMPRVRAVTGAQIAAASEKEDEDYRRGYVDGYTESMNDMRAVMSKGGYSRPREAWNILHRFCELMLYPWRAYRNTPYAEPPQFVMPQSWDAMRRRVFARDDHTCVLCGSGEDLQCDHVHEVRNGGLPDMDNLRTLCATCHRARKGEA